MKKLNKLQINAEKIMRSEELIILTGGYDGDRSCCMCYQGMTPKGIMAAWGMEDCRDQCGYMGWQGSWGNCTF